MARSFSFSILIVSAGLSCAAAFPALAQFGSIFGGDGPPRPPADVPVRRSAPNNFPEPQFEPRNTPAAPQPRDYPRLTRPPPPSDTANTRTAPAGPRGGIQSQPLPPPPGGRAAPIEAGPPPQSPQTAAPRPGSITPLPSPEGGSEGTEASLPPEGTVVEPPAQRISNPTAVFAGLDKITGRITSFEVAVGETVQFGALQVTPRVCYSRPPTESARTDAFLAVDEVTLQGEVRRIFTGWMFAASPGLHAVEHPIYDVWLTDCKGGTLTVAGTDDQAAPATPASQPKPATPAPQRAGPRRR
jgi:hypothetical protein